MRPNVVLTFAAACIVTAGAFAQVSNPQPTTAPSTPATPSTLVNWPIQLNYRENYSVLSEHNMFLRERGRRDSGRNSSSTQPARSAEQSYVLRGVVMEGNEPRAYFEDLNHSSGVVKVGIGESLGRGKISDISIDAVAFQLEGRDAVWVQIGSDLTGSTSSAGTAATTMPSGPIDPNAPGLTLEQRMKARRMQEMNRH
jgi:hypothetical protein